LKSNQLPNYSRNYESNYAKAILFGESFSQGSFFVIPIPFPTPATSIAVSRAVIIQINSKT